MNGLDLKNLRYSYLKNSITSKKKKKKKPLKIYDKSFFSSPLFMLDLQPPRLVVYMTVTVLDFNEKQAPFSVPESRPP
jgi:hypothetical protein